eukprot:TRINITY_DN10474_c2_g1_i1.p1 TRINITY_DN10474_c2_g1~~TRINITY_DN10474_c2_g1_i1.p1  ORF type:complete len:148 (+),score=7.65 TRINITY_DN10474_c2_g1_i1:423-866(+)
MFLEGAIWRHKGGHDLKHLFSREVLSRKSKKKKKVTLKKPQFCVNPQTNTPKKHHSEIWVYAEINSIQKWKSILTSLIVQPLPINFAQLHYVSNNCVRAPGMLTFLELRVVFLYSEQFFLDTEQFFRFFSPQIQSLFFLDQEPFLWV